MSKPRPRPRPWGGGFYMQRAQYQEAEFGVINDVLEVKNSKEIFLWLVKVEVKSNFLYLYRDEYSKAANRPLKYLCCEPAASRLGQNTGTSGSSPLILAHHFGSWRWTRTGGMSSSSPSSSSSTSASKSTNCFPSNEGSCSALVRAVAIFSPRPL